MKKHLNVGTLPDYNNKQRNLWLTIKLTNNTRLSITGVHGPRANGDCYGAAGQNIEDLKRLVAGEGQQKLDPNTLNNLLTIWQKWHLNDMNAGCIHQDDWPTAEKGLQTQKPRGHVRYDQHPDEGLLCKPCSICGYKYGSAWLYRELPDHVLNFIKNLPEHGGYPWH